MTFQVAKAGSASPRASRSTSRASLPPDLMAAGVRRLKIAAALAFGVTAAFAVLDFFVPPPAPPASRLLSLVAIALGSLLSVAIFFVAVRRSGDPEFVLDMAMLYEVANALMIAINYHAVPLATRDTSRGWSGVAVWVMIFPLFIPHTRGKVILATIAAVAMEPIAILLHVAAGAPAPSLGKVLQALSPTAVGAFLGIYVSGVMYRLSVEASRAREMGSYRLIEPLGSGGMGEVWRAEHRMLARPAAIKLIRAGGYGGGASSRELIRRFEREARATATLRSPHTVQIYDFGTTDDGSFYYVMELLEGYDLETLVTEFGPLPPERAISLLRQACRSLAEAHEGGFIHRDIKPANIYACRYGVEYDFVKVLDFGLVKSSIDDGGGASLTAVGTIAGTPGYMAPEVAHGNRDVDWRADIYSLGCVAYWLVTGHPVFERESAVEVLLDHASTRPVPPSEKAPGMIPPALDDLILACLRKDPNNRPQSVVEISDTLGRVETALDWTADQARRWWLRNPPSRRAKVPATDPTVPLHELGELVAPEK
jgi:serine/threonine-protein kinase